MEFQLVVLAAFIALFGSTRSAPQNAVTVEEAAGEAVAVAEERGADASQSDYQNDYYYRYGTRYANGMYYAPYPYITKALYDQKVLELAQCTVERDALLASASPDLQEEAAAPAGDAKEEEEEEKEEEEAVEEAAPMCSAKADIGPCRSYVARYFYDEASDSCKMFTYGGCGGNSNNYRTQYECERSCKPASVCSQPSSVGYCLGRLPRYYFSSATGRCELFYYGGCGGNGNNFMTQQECQATCDSMCTMPKDEGPCRGAYARWYHNTENNQCEVFIFGGCGGNTNNFRTKSACDAHC